MIGYISRLGKSGTVNSNGHDTKGITGTGGLEDTRPYNILETNIIDTLVHYSADIGSIEEININNMKFTNKEKNINSDIYEIHSLTDAIKRLDAIIGNYYSIENEENSNLLNHNEDIVTTINYLSKDIIGYVNILETNINNIKEKSTVIEILNYLSSLLGTVSSITTGCNNLDGIENLTDAIIKLDELVGKINFNSTKNLQEITNIQDAIIMLDKNLGKVLEENDL